MVYLNSNPHDCRHLANLLLAAFVVILLFVLMSCVDSWRNDSTPWLNFIAVAYLWQLARASKNDMRKKQYPIEALIYGLLPCNQ